MHSHHYKSACKAALQSLLALCDIMKLITFICVTILSCKSFLVAARTQSNTEVAQCSGSIAQLEDEEMRFDLEWSADSDLSAVVLSLSSYVNRSDWIGIKLLIDSVSKYKC